jgi:PilZ domain
MNFTLLPKLHPLLSFTHLKPRSESEQHARAINVSTRGVSFVTSLPVSVGEIIEVLLEIPMRITGVKATSRRFTGRVTHIESDNMPQGISIVGVQLLYYEFPAGRPAEICTSSVPN